MEKEEISQKLLKELYEYKDGYLYHKTKTNGRKIGDVAGRVSVLKRETRHDMSIKGVGKLTARMIFLWHHGYLPAEVDHIDRNKLNNKIENLRAATRSQNMRNKSSAKNSTSKYLGVCLHQTKYWKAQIRIGKHHINIGNYKTQELAALAYNKAAVFHFGEYANLNIINND